METKWLQVFIAPVTQVQETYLIFISKGNNMCFKCPHSLSLARNPILGNFFHNAFPIPPKVLPEPQGYHCQYSLSRSAFLSEEIKVAPLAQCQALN